MSSLKYRPDIDGLRAIAVLLVVVFHFNLVAGGKAGFIGVDVFFVISGFLITAILVKQLDAGTFSFGSFYLHRIRRLAPALFAVLLLVMLTGSVLLFPSGFEDLAKQVLVSQFYVANIYYWRSINYFGLNADNVYLLHTWSLAVEEQFYLLYPLCIYFLHRYRRSWMWSILALAFLGSFMLNLGFVTAKPEATFYLLPTRAWELLAGSLTYYASRNFPRARAINELLGVGGLGLIAIGVATYFDGVSFPGAFALLPTIGAALVLASGSDGTATVARLLSIKPVVYIGRISYTLYLVHWPVNVFSKQFFDDGYTTPMRAVMCAFAFVLSMLIFHVVEQPVRSKRYLASGAGIARSYVAGLAATAAIVVTVHLMHGLPQRFPDETIRLANFVNDRGDALEECWFKGKPLVKENHFCRIGRKGTKPVWLVYGDSHAWAGYEAFDEWLAGRGEAGFFMFRNSCPPITGVHIFRDHGLCFAFNEAVTRFLESQPGVTNVLLVSTWRQGKVGISTSANLPLSESESLKLFEVRFAETLQRLASSGKRIYVWEPVPGGRQNVPLALANATRSNRPSNIEFRRDEYFSEFDFFFRAIEKDRRLIAQTFSPSSILCESGSCQVTANGNPLYFDNAHVTRSSSGFWVGMLNRQYAANERR